MQEEEGSASLYSCTPPITPSLRLACEVEKHRSRIDADTYTNNVHVHDACSASMHPETRIPQLAKLARTYVRCVRMVYINLNESDIFCLA